MTREQSDILEPVIVRDTDGVPVNLEGFDVVLIAEHEDGRVSESTPVILDRIRGEIRRDLEATVRRYQYRITSAECVWWTALCDRTDEPVQ